MRNRERTIRRRHIGRVFAACAAVAALAAGCSSAASSGSAGSGSTGIPAGPITFGATLPLSGPAAQAGDSYKAGFEAVASVMNASGGIDGHKINLDILDDKGDPATALANARTLVSQHVDGVLMASLGAPSELVLPYLMKEGVPASLGESNTDFLDVAKYPSYFTPFASAAQYADAYIAFIKAHHLNNLGTLSDGTPIANQASSEIAKEAPAAGLTVTTAQTYSPTAADLTPVLLKLKQAGTQVVVLNGYQESSNVFQALNQIGWAPTVIGVGPLYATVASLGAVKNKTYTWCTYHYSQLSQQPSGPAKQALAKMMAAVGDDLDASTVLGYYDNFLTLAAGIEKANSTNYAAVVKALNSGVTVKSVWPGVSFTYSASNHEGMPAGALQVCPVQPLGYGGVQVLAQ